MNLRQALFIAACTIAAATGPAAAQFQPAPQQQQQQPPSCVEFGKLHSAFEKRGKALQAAGQRANKPTPQEACKLFNAFTAAVASMIKFAQENDLVWCGVPPQMVEQLKRTQAGANDTRTKVCAMAAQPARPAAPSLSDALNAPVPSSSNIKSGGGTFDTLTGTPLGSK